MTASGVTLRVPQESDWPVIAELADAALDHVEGAAPQHEWVENRRAFEGEQHQRDAVVDGRVVGYAAIERRHTEPAGLYRLFVVTSWRDTPEIAAPLYEAMERELGARGATAVWLRELADDDRLIAFARARGFVQRDRYSLGGLDIVRLDRLLSSHAERTSS